MNEKRQICFYYDGELRDEDIIMDPDGTAPVPEKGEVIRMHLQNWRVTHVGKTEGREGNLVVYKVYLARA